MSEFTVGAVDAMAEEDRYAVIDGLVDYNRAQGHAWRRERLDVLARGEDGRVVGGLLGEVHLGWLFVAALWVEEPARGGGLGSTIMAEAEAEARRRGCTGIFLDTFSFQARPFYERLGFQLFGELHDCPPGETRYYLAKRLPAEPDWKAPRP